MAPLAVATAPAEGEDSIQELADARLATITDGGEIGNHPEIPEDQ